MASQSDLFSRLKKYEVPPPPEAFQLLCNRLGLEGESASLLDSLQQLQQLDLMPPVSLREKITEAVTALPALVYLQHEVILPPAGTYERIAKELSLKKDKSATKRLLFTPYRIAAACILVLLVAGGIYLLLPKQKTPSQTAVIHTEPSDSSAEQFVTTQPSDSSTQTAAAPVYQDYDNPNALNFFKTKSFKTEGAFVTITDNDFIVTFASFNPEELPEFLRKEENKDQVIRLDQHSYFTISASMVEMLKKMYATKSKGTPTRKARKEKEKLEQWKKADEKRFDQSMANPLDPIDLGEFIFKY
ncbi:MAG: hypothetical protein QM731_00590 [Chitinophagaceae bacterium]